MKLYIKLFAFVVVLIVGVCTTPQKGAAQAVSVNFQLFYDQLSPYGTWVDYQNYGYVWIPEVDREFSPYGSDGHWIFTYDGWTWVSDYSWGWAPFHYGRWAYDDSYGWLWVPHNEWGPAWVTWRRSEGYYGWAPMRPGISIEFSFGEGYRVPDNQWRFVSSRDISRADIDRHYVDRSTNVTIINSSTVINNTYVDNSRHTTYVAGPKRDEVQKVTGTTIRPVAIQENDKPGQSLNNDQLRIYRPHVQTNVVNEQKPVPTNVVKLAEVTPVAERKQGNQHKDNPAPTPNKQPSQPQNPAAIDKKAASDMPPAAPPHDEKKNMQEKPVANPQGNQGEVKQPVPVNPEDRNKNTQQQSQPPNADVKGKSSTGTPPVVADPNAKNKNPEHLAPPPNGNQKETKSAPQQKTQAGQQPPAANPNDKNKGATPPPAKTKGKPAKSPPAKIQGEDNKAPKSDKPKKDSTSNHSQIQLR